MPTISSVRVENLSPLHIQQGKEDTFKVFATIDDTVSVTSVEISSNDPVLLTLVIDPVNPIINNVGDFQFHLKAVANDFSLGSNLVTLTITAINKNNESVTYDINYEIIVTNLLTGAGLRLPGALSVIQANLQSVGSSLDVNIKYQVQATDRSKADGSTSFTHFIQTDYNLNSLVNYFPSDTNFDKDDAYSLRGLTINSNESNGTILSLPAASLVPVKAGEIDAQDQSGNSLGKFPVNLYITCNDQGIISSTISISGNDITPGNELLDDAHKSQVVYWPPFHDRPTVEPDDADVLNTKITSSQITNYYLSTLNTINNMYDGESLIASWSISLSPITQSTSNILAQHARFINKRGNEAIFSENDKIVVATPFSYSVSIEDYLGDNTVIVPNANIFGVINHKA